MSLAPGGRIGVYTIGEEIGSGGMGVVYRATDTNLKRDVAIKALPESFSTDADWVARFEREAQTLAALNHPNIAHIYGLERGEGTTALVMELVEGPTLADRIADGPLPPDEAFNIAMQVADALEAAHGQGIVHRDLKPANIKLKPDGTVKVLDFGIAKSLDIRAASGQPTPAMTTPAMTQTGIILGTAAYMSPEQARGKPIDQRTDIWAFGCLLYEMLTGQPAFAGEDVAITLARILANDTNMKSLPRAISPAVRHTIGLCLEKDERKRIADIRDVRLALAGAFETVPSGVAVDRAIAQPLWRRTLPLAAMIVLTGVLVTLVAWLLWFSSEEPALHRVTRFHHELENGQMFRNTAVRVVAISPDGSSFVYNTDDGLFLRRLGELEARLIPGTESGLYAPTFSPDGQWIAYVDTVSRQIKRIAVSGGAPVNIADASGSIDNLSWETDGTILFGVLDEGIYRVAATSGIPEQIIARPIDEILYGPRLLPDGDTILLTALQRGSGTWETAEVVAYSLATGERTVLVSGGADAHYLPTGHLVYAFGDGLFAVRFDPETLRTSGGAVPLVQGVMRAPAGQSGVADFSIAADGTLVYVVAGAETTTRQLVWVDRAGVETQISAEPRYYVNPRISPDGMRVALDIRDQERDIWTWDLERETLTRLTFDPAEDEFPEWSPDGQRIAYASGNQAVYVQGADGSGSRELVAQSDSQLFPSDFSPDGAQLVIFGASAGTEDDDISLLGLADGSEIQPLIQTTFRERGPVLSPDGRWLAYSSEESGLEQIYVRPFPDVGAGRWQISTAGGEQPVWAHSGRELFFRSGAALMAATVDTEQGFRAGRPQVLFEGPYVLTPGGTTYDVSPDDARFLMIRPTQQDSVRSQIIVVENWFEEVNRLAPSLE